MSRRHGEILAERIHEALRRHGEARAAISAYDAVHGVTYGGRPDSDLPAERLALRRSYAAAAKAADEATHAYDARQARLANQACAALAEEARS